MQVQVSDVFPFCAHIVLTLFYRYERGSIGFGYYEALYHSVEPWKPTPPPKYMAEGRVTSGRMSTVFFSPAKALNMLKGRDAGWLVESGGAVNPNMKPVAPIRRPKV